MPTFTQPHIKVTVIGDAWDGGETWQFGVNCSFGAGGEPTNAGLQTLADALAVPTQTFIQSSETLVSSNAHLTSVKCALIDVTGHYPAASAPGIHAYVPPIAGSGPANAIPQATIAVTLLTDIPRGRASSGRFYLPPTSPGIQSDGRITVAVRDALAGRAKDWLNAVRGNILVGEILVMSGLGTGTTGVVDRIGVGRVVDTMRSRRRSLPELRQPLLL